MSSEAGDSTAPGGEAGTAPLRLWLQDETRGAGRMCVLHEPFRLGFGDECDIRLEGEEGPDVLFEVEQARGPLLVARAVAPSEYESYVDLTLDGQPLRDTRRGLAPGSRLEIVDKRSGRRYQVVVSPRAAVLRPRNLALVMLVLALAGAAFGGYLYWSLERARSDITRTGSRVEQAEAELAVTERRLRESLERIEYTEAELDEALEELRRLGEASARAMRAEFAQRLQAIADDSRQALARLAERDVEGREQLRRQAQQQAEALRAELSDRMVESYRQIQGLEQRLLAAMVERIAAREPGTERLKRVFHEASKATLLVHASYEIEFLREGSRSPGGSFGTGFLASPSGLAVTAQHVLFPWRYDRDFLVLEQLGLVRVVPESVHWLVWRVGARALPDPDDPGVVDPDTAYGSHEGRHRLRLLHAPPPVTSVQMVSSPVGVIEVPMPVPGASDSAVLQLLDFDTVLPHLPPSADTARPGALDEVLLLGYPFSRLPEGVAEPQGIRGLVRTPGDELLELDAAVHSGLSGGPVVDQDGALVGMVTATLRSDVYAVALSLDVLVDLLAQTRTRVREEEARLAALGCDPGEVDGVFDARTEEGYRCAARRGAHDAPGTAP